MKKQYGNFILLSFLAFLLLVAHIYFSWSMPSEDHHLIIALWSWLISMVLIVAFHLFSISRKTEKKLFYYLRNYFIVTFTLINFHFFAGEYARKIWPWSSLESEIKNNCTQSGCKPEFGNKYTFPIINQEVSYYVLEGCLGGCIYVDYNVGRTASFDLYNLKELHVD